MRKLFFKFNGPFAGCEAVHGERSQSVESRILPMFNRTKHLSAGHDDNGGGLCKDRRIRGRVRRGGPRPACWRHCRRQPYNTRPVWVIKDGLEKVVQSATESEHGLSCMNEFGGAAADTMTTQQSSVFTVKKHFEH